MKKTATGLFIVSLIMVLLNFAWYFEPHYTKDVKVISVKNQEVKCEDIQGYQWTFIGKGYTIGQDLKIVMFDNHTSNIFDDKIIKVK